MIYHSHFYTTLMALFPKSKVLKCLFCAVHVLGLVDLKQVIKGRENFIFYTKAFTHCADLQMADDNHLPIPVSLLDRQTHIKYVQYWLPANCCEIDSRIGVTLRNSASGYGFYRLLNVPYPHGNFPTSTLESADSTTESANSIV